MLDVVLIFAAVLALDVVYARYTVTLTQGRRFAASVYAAGIIAFSGFNAISFVSNPWLILPAMAGAFVGTWIGSRSA